MHLFVAQVYSAHDKLEDGSDIRGINIAITIGIATNGIEAVAKVRDLLPDVVTMDARMPTMDGAEATRLIKEAHPDVGVLFVCADVEHIDQGTAAAADGYVVENCEPEWLFSEVRIISARMRGAKPSTG